MTNNTHPTYGIDVAGANTYTEIIASPRGAGDEENKEYTHMKVWCTTKDAIVSLDGGKNNHIFVPAGKEPLVFDDVKITQAIKGKNATSGQNYANLIVIVW